MLTIVTGPPSKDRAQRTPSQSRAKRNPYRCPDQSAAPGDPMTILRDVPLPNGAVAIRVAVTRLPDMPGWSTVDTRGGPDCGLSVEDLDPRELHEPREVMRAALRIALHMFGAPRG